MTDMDGGTEYRYEGGGKIKRTGKPSANAQRKAEDEAAEELREAREKEKREKASKRSKAASAKPAPTPTKTELVKVARIGDTPEFGVYPESCVEYTKAKALATGTRQVCEGERDRIKAERLAKNEVGHTTAHQKQEQSSAADALVAATTSLGESAVENDCAALCDPDYTEDEVAMFAEGGK